jgi:hypothetical protein
VNEAKGRAPHRVPRQAHDTARASFQRRR